MSSGVITFKETNGLGDGFISIMTFLLVSLVWMHCGGHGAIPVLIFILALVLNFVGDNKAYFKKRYGKPPAKTETEKRHGGTNIIDAPDFE